MLFFLGFALYVFTRLYRIADFPIYFFTDEAIQAFRAHELLQRNFYDNLGHYLPSYFQNGDYWNLSLSVWLQVIPVKLFGMDVSLTRGVPATVTASAAVAVALIAKKIFNFQYWWISTFIFASIPAWYLHSRTAFETTLMVSMYSWFMFFYLMYRHKHVNYIFPAILFGAATFYSYANGQAVMFITGILLLISDFKYHWKAPKIPVLALGLLLGIPYLRFRLQHPDVIADHLRTLHSYWMEDLTVSEKLQTFFSYYIWGISPNYWFFEHGHELIRHNMKGYSHISTWLFPFFCIGLIIALRQIKQPANRALLVAILAAPLSASLVGIGVTRVLLFVVPATLLCTAGLDFTLNKLIKTSNNLIQAFIALAFSLVTLLMMHDSLKNGPTWYTDYGMYGMQWGAKQLLTEAKKIASGRAVPQVSLPSDWANGTEVFSKFFAADERKILVNDVYRYFEKNVYISPNSKFFVTADQLKKVKALEIFENPDTSWVINYPDGNPAFYVIDLKYKQNAPAYFQKIKEARAVKISEELEIKSRKATVLHHKFDMGQTSLLFDGDVNTLVRGVDVNPLQIEITLETPLKLRGLNLTIGTMTYRIDITWISESGEEMALSKTSREQIQDPTLEFNLDKEFLTKRIIISLTDLSPYEDTHIHVREIELRE